MRLIIAALCAAWSAASHAQELISFNWSWAEVVAGTTIPVAAPNGLLEPGESAEIRLTVHVSPAVGSVVNYSPPPPPGVGVLSGLASIFFSLEMNGGFDGSFSHGRRAEGMTIGSHGTIHENWLLHIQAGQIAFPEVPLANVSNPVVDMWRIVWNPATYDDRMITFIGHVGHLFGSAVYIRYGGTEEFPLWVSKPLPVMYGTFQIPVVPAPPGSAALALALLASRRNRPARHHGPALEE